MLVDLDIVTQSWALQAGGPSLDNFWCCPFRIHRGHLWGCLGAARSSVLHKHAAQLSLWPDNSSLLAPGAHRDCCVNRGWPHPRQNSPLGAPDSTRSAPFGLPPASPINPGLFANYWVWIFGVERVFVVVFWKKPRVPMGGRALLQAKATLRALPGID